MISLPLGLGQFFARVLTRLMDSPPITEPMLGVLDHDDAVDCQETLHRLNLQLTPLDRVLEGVLQLTGDDRQGNFCRINHAMCSDFIGPSLLG